MPLDPEDMIFLARVGHPGNVESKFWRIGAPRGTGTLRNKFKDKLRDYLLIEQGGCCAYCGFGFETKGTAHRDHIAPKDLFARFTFEVENLILACPVCNGLGMKKNVDTILASHTEYDQCTFKLVHPYYDEYDDHIELEEGNAIIKMKTIKGEFTIDLFKLASVEKTTSRMQCIIFEKIKDLPQEALDQIEAIYRARQS